MQLADWPPRMSSHVCTGHSFQTALPLYLKHEQCFPWSPSRKSHSSMCPRVHATLSSPKGKQYWHTLSRCPAPVAGAADNWTPVHLVCRQNSTPLHHGVKLSPLLFVMHLCGLLGNFAHLPVQMCGKQIPAHGWDDACTAWQPDSNFQRNRVHHLLIPCAMVASSLGFALQFNGWNVLVCFFCTMVCFLPHISQCQVVWPQLCTIYQGSEDVNDYSVFHI